MAETSYTKGEERPPGADIRSPEGDDPNKPDVAAGTDPTTSIPASGKRLSPTPSVPKKTGAAGAAKSSRSIAAISRSPGPGPARLAERPIPPRSATAQHLQHPLRQHRSDAAGGLLETAGPGRAFAFRQEIARCRPRRRRRRSSPAASDCLRRACRAGPRPSGHASGRGPAGSTAAADGPARPGRGSRAARGPDAPSATSRTTTARRNDTPNAPSAGSRSPAANDA